MPAAAAPRCAPATIAHSTPTVPAFHMVNLNIRQLELGIHFHLMSISVAEAVNGYCDNNCKNFIYFILIFAICVFMHSTSEVGSMLLVMRCTHPKGESTNLAENFPLKYTSIPDKAMAMGVIQSAIGLFGNVPCPIIYGAVVDSACLIWKSVCGKHGACSLYDADTFRQYFLGKLPILSGTEAARTKLLSLSLSTLQA